MLLCLYALGIKGNNVTAGKRNSISVYVIVYFLDFIYDYQ